MNPFQRFVGIDWSGAKGATQPAFKSLNSTLIHCSLG